MVIGDLKANRGLQSKGSGAENAAGLGNKGLR